MSSLTAGVQDLLSDEERQGIYEMLRETAREDASGAGFVLEGKDPYAADWDMDLSWPEDCPDNLDAEVASATLVVGKQYKKNGRLRASTTRRMHFDASEIRAMREAVNWSKLKEDWPGSADPFAYGVSGSVSGLGNALSQYVPLWPGPVTRQLYWQDYWQMSAKSFEAYNHDPISWRCIHMKAEFALGRGLECKVTRSRDGSGKKGQGHDKAQQIWDEFWTRNKMDRRLDTIARDLCWGGEQFLRYFKNTNKLSVRALDPASVYDLITDPEDIETVFAYHQQFQTAYQLYPPDSTTPPTGIQAPTGATERGSSVKYIIRQILPQEIDHYKANASGYERRGRSDLFPALGWIKRLRDYLTAHVVQADMLARICWDLEVAGNQTAISTLRNQLFPGGRAPAPGTVFGHNTASKLNAVVPQKAGASTSRGDPILDALVTLVSLSAGLPKDWLGFGMQNTRAGALVATEPAAKSLEELQGTIEGIIHDAFNRVMAAARISDAQLEVTFPSIASEDRKSKLDDLGTMEGSGWLSKQTSATLAAKEMGISTYDFDAEQQIIAQEFDNADEQDADGKPKQGGGKIRRQVILATKRQAPKLDITQAPIFEDEPPGLLVPEDGNPPAPGSPDGTGRTVAGGGSHKTQATRGGMHANENPMGSEGASNIRKDNTKLRQSEEILQELEELRGAVRSLREDGARRKPDDPDYTQIAREYSTESAIHIRDLAQSAIDLVRENAQQAAEERKEERSWISKLLRRPEAIREPSRDE